jgi:LemA protein
MKEEACSDVLVRLKQRHDLIPNLVETLKGYSRHEQGTFEDVAAKRAAAIGAIALDERAEAEHALTRSLGEVFAIAESCPELKASQNFLSLQQSLLKTEEQLREARHYFNGTVREYNILVQSFPSLLIAGMLNLTSAEYYDLDAPDEWQVPRVDLTD